MSLVRRFVLPHSSECFGAESFCNLMKESLSLLYPSKEVARGHSEVAVINLSDAR
jgi:hypothetical protein